MGGGGGGGGGVMKGAVSAGIFKQSMGARYRVVVPPAHQAKQPSGIGSLESMIGLLKSLKIRAQSAKRSLE